MPLSQDGDRLMDTTTMLAQGTLLRGGTYCIEKQLASGGFGNTYLVRNVAFNEIYAMKEFFMSGINMRNGNDVTVSVPDNHASYDSQKEKFKKEAIRLRNLRNKHIVKVHDLFEENNTAYYVMDYIDGKSLSEQIKHNGSAFSEEQTWHILPQVLDALKKVHSQNIWHLDIKPGNIMLDKNGDAFLIDFGASKQLNTSGSQTSSALCYTPGYAPVEQVEQAMDKFGPWTDFYALGATLYYIQSLKQPPSSTSISEGDAFNFPPTMSRKMRDLIVWMMKPSRKQRPQSVDDIVARIAPIGSVPQQSGDTDFQQPGDNTAQALSKEKSGRSGIVALISLLIVAVLGAGTYFLFFDKSEAEKAAEADQDEYEAKVEKCRSAINSADDFLELEDAKTLFRPLQKLENEHAAAMPDVYDKLDDLKKLYDKKLKKQKQEYIDLADKSISLNDYRTAYDLYKEASDALSDDDEMNDKCQELAVQMGYIYVTDCKFANRLNGENIEEAALRLKKADMRYLTPLVTYNSLLPSGHATVEQEFTYKVFNPDGSLDRADSSPAGYTNDTSFEVEVGEHDQGVWLAGWGNATQSLFDRGEYTFELYYKGHRIYDTKFTLY